MKPTDRQPLNLDEVSLPCPECRKRARLEGGDRSQRVRVVCQNHACGWIGTLAEAQAHLETALEGAEPSIQPQDAPQQSFAPKPGESLRDRHLATRAMHERLRELGFRAPVEMAMSDGSVPLTDAEVAQRDARPAMTEEERQREARIQMRLRQAGLTPAGIVYRGTNGYFTGR
jgi:hypothetical protein